MIEPNRVFIYGSLKQGKPNHGLIEGSFDFIGQAVTKHPYPLVMHHGLPYLLPFVGCGYPVKGELMDFDADCMDELDRIEGVPHHYVRMAIPVICATVTCIAWTYFRSQTYLNLRGAKYIREY